MVKEKLEELGPAYTKRLAQLKAENGSADTLQMKSKVALTYYQDLLGASRVKLER